MQKYNCFKIFEFISSINHYYLFYRYLYIPFLNDFSFKKNSFIYICNKISLESGLDICTE